MYLKNILCVILWISVNILEINSQLDTGFWWLNKGLTKGNSEQRSLSDKKAKIRTLPPLFRRDKGKTTTESPFYDNSVSDSDSGEEDKRMFKYDDEPDCSCVPNYLCNGTIITDGSGLIDERSGLCRAGEVCCRIAKTTTTSRPTKPPSVFATFLKPVQYEKCGKRGGRIEKRILIDFGDGSDESEEELETKGESAFGEFPWMIEIQKWNKLKSEFEYLCGGVLINPSTALTATHCVKSVKKFSNLRIRAGEWDRETTNEFLPHQDRIVSRVINHPQYYSGGLYNDVSIIKWNEPLDMTQSNVQSICLPDENHVFEGQICTASGWGKDSFQNGRHSQILKYVELPIVEQRRCEKQLQDFKFGRRFKLHDSFICAGGDVNSDTCEGDGGSPLICKRDGTYTLAGLVSWGVGCGQPVPGVYTNIPKLSKWIKLNM